MPLNGKRLPFPFFIIFYQNLHILNIHGWIGQRKHKTSHNNMKGRLLEGLLFKLFWNPYFCTLNPRLRTLKQRINITANKEFNFTQF